MKFISSQDEVAIEAHLSRDNAPENETLYSCGGVYMHGRLQDEIGYDIPILLEGDMQTGINICEVQFPSGEIHLAIAYVWETKMKVNSWGVRGLIVYANDSDLDYVRECYSKKVEHL